MIFMHYRGKNGVHAQKCLHKLVFKAVAFNLLDYIPPSCPQQYLKACGYMNKGKYYTKTFALNF